MQLSVPFYSQYGDDVPEIWRPHACTVANTKMVLDFFLGAENVSSLAELITEAESTGGFGPRGWTHDTIVYLCHNHGLHAYRQEFRSRDARHEEKLSQEGVEKIKQALTNGFPTIVSVQKENGSYHTVTVIGMTDTGFIYHDPETGPSQEMSFGDFVRQWRKLAIFTYR